MLPLNRPHEVRTWTKIGSVGTRLTSKFGPIASKGAGRADYRLTLSFGSPILAQFWAAPARDIWPPTIGHALPAAYCWTIGRLFSTACFLPLATGRLLLAASHMFDENPCNRYDKWGSEKSGPKVAAGTGLPRLERHCLAPPTFGSGA